MLPHSSTPTTTPVGEPAKDVMMSAPKSPTTLSTVTCLNDYREVSSAESSGLIHVVHDEPAPLFAPRLAPGFIASHGPAGRLSLREGCESLDHERASGVRHLRSVERLSG